MSSPAAKLETVAGPLKLNSNERARLYAEHLVMLALGKSCYKRADALLEVALHQSNRYEPAKITRRRLAQKEIKTRLRDALKMIAATIEGKQFAISDKFANRNSVPVGQNARRFEIEEFST